MNFRSASLVLLFLVIVSLVGCSDTEKEKNLVDLFTTASQDVIDIYFPVSTETTVSINSEVIFKLNGLKSNASDEITLTRDIDWSLSEGAQSTIDQNGRLRTGNSAELITLTATFGALSTSMDISVSAAEFDRVVQLDYLTLDIEMCRSQRFRPVGRYEDDNGNEEIRLVDSNIINTIEWIVLNQEDSSPSKRAFIETTNNQTTLHSLAAGDLVIRARAPSVLTNSVVTSADFNQTVGNRLNTIKLCRLSDTDLNSCEVTTASIEKDQSLDLIAVGNYQASDGTTFNENITRKSKWGNSNPVNASTAFAADFDHLSITGQVESSSIELSLACGTIDQSLDAIEISQGVNLDIPLSCAGGSDCSETSASINIDQLSVTSLEVTANDIELTDNQTTTLGSRPDEISLNVEATFSNNTVSDITDNNATVYTIIEIDGQADVIEEKSGSDGKFDVLGAGTAKIQIDFRGETFIAILEVP